MTDHNVTDIPQSGDKAASGAFSTGPEPAHNEPHVCPVAYCRGGHDEGGLHDIPPCLKTCEWKVVNVRRKHDPACPNANWRPR